MRFHIRQLRAFSKVMSVISEFKQVFNSLPRKTKFTWILASFLGLLNAAIEILISILIGILLSVTINGNFGIEKLPIVGTVLSSSLIWALLFAILVKFIFNVLEFGAKATATTESISYYSTKLIDSILNSDSNSKSSASRLHVTVIDDTNYAFRWYFFGFISLISNVFTFSALFFIALISELSMTLFFGAILVAIVIPVSWWVNFSQIKLNSELQSVSNSIYNLIKQTLDIKTEIQLYKKRDDFKKLFSQKRYKKANLESQALMRANYPRIAIEISFLLSIFAFALISSLNDSVDYTDRTFYIFVFCVLRLVPIFGRITNDVTSIKAGTPALSSIAKIEMKKVSNDDDKNIFALIENFKSEISLEGISYYFDESSDPQLKNVFLRIERGDKIAIVGGSGQGKTTLLEIILGLRKPTNGQILIDGKLLENYELWKPYVGYVSQKYEVYDHSLRQAVTFDFFSDDIDVNRFAKISNALEFEEATIARLQNFSEESKFNQNLSGGQLQRIAIARALYSQSNFLVLDEVTSNLDAQTSKKIIELLLNSDRTVLLVTHKLSEVSDFDKIIRVKDGEVSIDIR